MQSNFKDYVGLEYLEGNYYDELTTFLKQEILTIATMPENSYIFTPSDILTLDDRYDELSSDQQRAIENVISAVFLQRNLEQLDFGDNIARMVIRSDLEMVKYYQERNIPRQMTFSDWKRQEAHVLSTKNIELIPLRLSTPVIEEASMLDRKGSDYTETNVEVEIDLLRPPAIVKREMVSPNNIEQFKLTAEQVGFKNFELYIVRQRIQEKFMPTELIGSFDYTMSTGETIKIAGSPMISELNSLATEGIALSIQEREEIIKERFANYLRDLPDHNITIVSFPQREERTQIREESATHRGFMAMEGAVYQQKQVSANTVIHTYFFPHGIGKKREANTAKLQKLLLDTQFQDNLDRLEQLRGKAITVDRSKEQADKRLLQQQHMATLFIADHKVNEE